MNKLRKKSEIWFAVIWIIAYVVIMSASDSISVSAGIAKCVTLPAAVILSAVLFIFVKKNGLMNYYGLCKGEHDAKKLLFFIPMIIAGSVNLWGGLALQMSVQESVLCALSMVFVGFLEELVFRGFLFKAIAKDNVTGAVIISSLTFGIGHIVNLLNGREIPETLMQIVYAAAIGFMLSMVFLRSGSIIPCIIFHSFVNASSTFGVSHGMTYEIIVNAAVTLLAGGYALYLLKAVKKNKIIETKE